MNDDRSDPAQNANNIGPAYSLVAKFESTVVQHELNHNLGAVQLSAPHASGGWHCFDEYDVMCYEDGASFFADGGTVSYNCPDGGDDATDCSHDDYYSASPDAGSYLADHWNMASSAFLSPVGPLDETGPTASFEDQSVQEVQRHGRAVSLRLRRHLVALGRIRAVRACRKRVEVAIQKPSRAKRWRTIARARTNRYGRFRIRLADRRGVYRSVAVRFSPRAGHACLRDRSPRRWHRH